MFIRPLVALTIITNIPTLHAQDCPQTLTHDELQHLSQGSAVQKESGTLSLATKGNISTQQSAALKQPDVNAVLKSENLMDRNTYSCVYNFQDSSGKTMSHNGLMTGSKVSITVTLKAFSLNASNLQSIIDKMKNNDALTLEENNEFNTALTYINKKIQAAGGKKTTLITIESKVLNQDSLNKITPTISDILESGKKFKWGIDLALVEQRGGKARTAGIGGEDVTSYITTFQKAKLTPNDPRYNVALNKIMNVTKLTKEQVESLPDLDTWKGMKGKQQQTIPPQRPNTQAGMRTQPPMRPSTQAGTRTQPPTRPSTQAGTRTQPPTRPSTQPLHDRSEG